MYCILIFSSCSDSVNVNVLHTAACSLIFRKFTRPQMQKANASKCLCFSLAKTFTENPSRVKKECITLCAKIYNFCYSFKGFDKYKGDQAMVNLLELFFDAQVWTLILGFRLDFLFVWSAKKMFWNDYTVFLRKEWESNISPWTFTQYYLLKIMLKQKLFKV